jgi:hypothetical protein
LSVMIMMLHGGGAAMIMPNAIVGIIQVAAASQRNAA